MWPYPPLNRNLFYMYFKKVLYISVNILPTALIYGGNAYLLSRGVAQNNIFIVLVASLASAVDLSIPLLLHASKSHPSRLVVEILKSRSFLACFFVLCLTVLTSSYLLAGTLSNVSALQLATALLLLASSVPCFLLRGWADRMQILSVSSFARLTQNIPSALIAPLSLLGSSTSVILAAVIIFRTPAIVYFLYLYKGRLVQRSRITAGRDIDRFHINRHILYLFLGSLSALLFSGFADRYIGKSFFDSESYIYFLYYADMAARVSGFAFSISLALTRFGAVRETPVMLFAAVTAFFLAFYGVTNLLACALSIVAGVLILALGQKLLMREAIAIRSAFPALQTLFFAVVILLASQATVLSYSTFVLSQCLFLLALALLRRCQISGPRELTSRSHSK